MKHQNGFIKGSKKIMLWILLCLVSLIVLVVIFEMLPFSKTKTQFANLTSIEIKKDKVETEVFTDKDIIGLPSPVQKYFNYCGYIGTAKMKNMRVSYDDVDFILSPDKPKFKIKYIHYNFVDNPSRIALIDTNMFGIPFEGIDTYQNGEGSMKGVVAKVITLFNQKGKEMDKASLATCLSECLLMPNLALQDFIKWEAIDDNKAKAQICYYGITASGIFTFDDNGAMKSFTTQDRENTGIDGKSQKVKWSAVCSDYKEINGIKYPSILKAVWHNPEGDLVYFDGKDITVKYDVKK